ncbi:ATP synthase F1 subunit gamma [Candidatus Mycoplasma mahonii]|uniref:ATP synthase F1 subunit gamma n=1 Tax=Candidatus Mycoplasma mahonii TaxID=3004105 RepID=UPI0026EF68B9|nr:ATP synthase F1 subunit gamma [Candidatus Mycoplasma mahonii]WKX02151.1 ATP synthase F1 subunit gamma [Candidatus Mycoplasma mahonii]
MASLQEIKSRLGSIITTKKITKAMQLVATAKLQKAQGNLKSIQEYYSSVYNTFQELLENVKDVKTLLPEKAEYSTLYILITSDIGLCGSYNSNIYKLAASDMKHNDKMIVIGTKGVSHFTSIGRKMIIQLPSAGDDPNYIFASEVGREAIALFLTRSIDCIKIVHTTFINSLTQEATITQLLPTDEMASKKSQTNKSLIVTEFEPSPEKVLLNVIPLYISAMIFGSMVESKVSEMSSRRIAMEKATDNAQDIIEHLELEYNRARQAAITQEISEIVAGADLE